ncbi:MAG TPA: hypothetical protein ENJ54_02745 [Chloroflexi bacterium]|nr:hypothetical protein [Chloroflexota bacterium]
MKMLIAVVQTADSNAVSQALIERGFRVTKLASTGGFLRRGSTTLLLGVEDEQVDEVVEIIRGECSQPAEPAIKQGVIFVLPVSRFERI